MSATPHIVLAGEGGHAHLLAGLAVADALAERMPDAAVTFVGSGRPIERHTVREKGYAYIAVPSQPPPQGPVEAIRFLAENFMGYWASRWILREQQVSLVIGFGGLSSGIMAKAAITRGLPTVLVEQNAVPSRVTRWLARSASAICTSFAETASLLPPTSPVHQTGFPVSSTVAALARGAPAGCRSSEGEGRRLLVLGGSAGASTLNRVVPAALGRLRPQLEGWHVVHQTGPGQLQAVEEHYRSLGTNALPISFIDGLAHVLSETDLVVSRAGGTTLAELAAAGVPALLLPHPDAADDHQLASAQVFVAAGACRLIDERSCEERFEDAIAEQLDQLLSNASERAKMAGAIRNFARPHAAQDIASISSQLLADGCDAGLAAA